MKDMGEYEEQQREVQDYDFSMLPECECVLDEILFAYITIMLPREPLKEKEGSENLYIITESDLVYEDAWIDEAAFYNWIVERRFCRELAEFLYRQTPEISLKAGSHYLYGVRDLMEVNDLDFRGFVVARSIIEAGFLIVGYNAADAVVVMDLSVECGRISYVELNPEGGRSSEDIRESAVFVAESLGDFIAEFEKERPKYPKTYELAKSMVSSVSEVSQDGLSGCLKSMWSDFVSLMGRLKLAYENCQTECFDQEAMLELCQAKFRNVKKAGNAYELNKVSGELEIRERFHREAEDEMGLYQQAYGRALIMRERYVNLNLTEDTSRVIEYDLKELKKICSSLKC